MDDDQPGLFGRDDAEVALPISVPGAFGEPYHALRFSTGAEASVRLYREGDCDQPKAMVMVLKLDDVRSREYPQPYAAHIIIDPFDEGSAYAITDADGPLRAGTREEVILQADVMLHELGYDLRGGD